VLLSPTFGKRVLFFLIADLLIGIFTLYSSYVLRFNFAIPAEFLEHFWRVAFVLTLSKALGFFIFKIYYKSWRYFGLQDLKHLMVAHSTAYIVFFIVFYSNREWFYPMPRSALLIDFFLSTVALLFLRVSKRLYLESGATGSPRSGKALVVGVGSKTPSIIKSAVAGDIPYRPVALVSEDRSVIGSYIENVKVYPMQSSASLVRRYGIETAIIAEDLSPRELDRVVEGLVDTGVSEIKLVSMLSDRKSRLKDIAIEDLLARKPKDLDMETIEEFIRGKRVLVSGAGGSIGSEICMQVKEAGASLLVMVDNCEYNLYRISEKIPEDMAVPVLMSVTHRERLSAIFEKYRPQIVIHAAAYKHVPLCESNVDEAVENNIAGVVNMVDLSIEYGAEKMVNISSDKAVRPTNVMGATKRVGELYAQNARSGDSEIVSVRFGNVLGSSGSVVPKFKEQIEAGGPVTVTHPEITRYFMLIPEACQLVLQAAAMARGGELFILDMGDPVKIVDLARKMIRLYGKEREIDIVYSGLRPGEKLYEELLIDDAECRTRYESIYVAAATEYPIEKLKSDIAELLENSDKREAIKRIVPEYSGGSNSEEYDKEVEI
jgi:UDP-N-acetyl-D-glucosamine 4,6-dehydratase